MMQPEVYLQTPPTEQKAQSLFISEEEGRRILSPQIDNFFAASEDIAYMSSHSSDISCSNQRKRESAESSSDSGKKEKKPKKKVSEP